MPSMRWIYHDSCLWGQTWHFQQRWAFRLERARAIRLMSPGSWKAHIVPILGYIRNGIMELKKLRDGWSGFITVRKEQASVELHRWHFLLQLYPVDSAMASHPKTAPKSQSAKITGFWFPTLRRYGQSPFTPMADAKKRWEPTLACTSYGFPWVNFHTANIQWSSMKAAMQQQPLPWRALWGCQPNTHWAVSNSCPPSTVPMVELQRGSVCTANALVTSHWSNNWFSHCFGDVLFAGKYQIQILPNVV